MKIKENIKTLKSCRYCPMCRHVCTSGNISFHESDYPRGRGLILDKIFEGREKYSPDIVNVIYNCCSCGLCWSNCEGGFKPHELFLSAREDIVDINKVPSEVLKIVNKMESGKNPYKGPSKALKGNGKRSRILFFMGDYIKFNGHSIADSVNKIFKRAGEEYTVFDHEPTDGKILRLLGFKNRAKKKALELHKRIEDLSPEVIIVSDPLSYDCLKNDFTEYGIELKPDVIHITQYLVDLLKSSKIKLKKINKNITLIDSEFLGRFNNIYDFPRIILKKIAGKHYLEMKNIKEKAIATGEAAFIFNGSNSTIGNIIGSRICKEAKDIGVKIAVTLSGIARENIGKCEDIDVFELSEFICQNIK